MGYLTEDGVLTIARVLNHLPGPWALGFDSSGLDAGSGEGHLAAGLVAALDALKAQGARDFLGVELDPTRVSFTQQLADSLRMGSGQEVFRHLSFMQGDLREMNYDKFTFAVFYDYVFPVEDLKEIATRVLASVHIKCIVTSRLPVWRGVAGFMESAAMGSRNEADDDFLVEGWRCASLPRRLWPPLL